MFSTNLRKLREERGMTQQELSKLVGVNPSAIGQYEIGIRLPNVAIAAELAKALGVSVDTLVREAE